MRLTKPQLLTPLQSVLGAVDKKGTIPILSHALVRLSHDGVVAIGTDSEQQIEATAPGMIEGAPLELCVPARKVVDILKLVPDGAEIELDVTDQTLLIKHGRSKAKVNLLDPAEFPVMRADSDHLGDVTIDAGQLGKAIARVAPAMGVKDVRYYFNGACLEVRGDIAHLIGTDGHRLHACRLSVSSTLTDDRAPIIPRDAVLELARLLPDQGEVTISLAERTVGVKLPSLVYTTRVIEGRFPDWRRVIPKPTLSIEIDREVVLAALRRVSLLANAHRGIAFELQEGALTLRATNESHETSEETLDLGYSGEPRAYGYNAAYLDAALNTIAHQKADLGLTEIGQALITTPDDDATQLVVSPMRL